MPIIISGDPTKSISLTGDQSKSIQASQVTPPPPAYIIPGLEQSHWLAENAVVNGGIVQSIPDYMGSSVSLVQENAYQPVNFNYSATGWQLNGKILPSLVAPSNGKPMRADAWASKLSGYSGAFTVAVLWDVVGASTSWCTTTNDTNTGQFGYTAQSWSPPTQPYRWHIKRSTASGTIFALNGTSGQNGSLGKQLVVQEYTGISAATDLAQFRLWVNGNQASLAQVGSGGLQTVSFTKFVVGGLSEAQIPANTKIAQFHIWKGALTDAQRDDVTAYLKSISGIV